MIKKYVLAWAIVLGIVIVPTVFAQGVAWRTYDPGFRALDITSGANNTIWACGSNATIAVSKDNGAHWDIQDKHEDGGLFLTIHFRGQFGYAIGTTGYVAFTHDGGATWRHTAIPFNDVLSGSFSDETHGLLQTRSAVLMTVDGNAWVSVSGTHASDFEKFPYVMSVVALDEMHMAIHISEPPPSRSGFLYTKDAGANWSFLEIPNVTITSLLIVDSKYWAVGTEVVDKDKPGGGHAVPLAIYSSDGEKWRHTLHDIQMCHWEGCGGNCTEQGCLAASGLALSIFDDKVDRVVFSPNEDLTVKWARTPVAICFVGAQLECTDARMDSSADAKSMEGSRPTAEAQRLMKALSTTGVQCIACGLQSMYVDAHANGSYTLKTTLLIDKNGLVESVDIKNAPSKTLEESLRHSMMGWVFLPALKDGAAVNIKLNTTAHVMVVQLR